MIAFDGSPQDIGKGPDDYWKSPKFCRRYTVNNINLVRENEPARLFNITCMMAILQGIQYLCEKPAALLDAGCGHGTRGLDIKAKLACRVVGVDYSDPMLEEARRINAMLPEERRVEIAKGDVTALEYDNATFDVVFTYGLLMSLPQLDKALVELLRVSRYGLVCIEESEDAMHDTQLAELNKVRTQKYPGRIYWHNYNRQACLAGARSVIFNPIPVVDGWSIGSPPAYGRYIIVKEAV